MYIQQVSQLVSYSYCAAVLQVLLFTYLYQNLLVTSILGTNVENNTSISRITSYDRPQSEIESSNGCCCVTKYSVTTVQQ